MANTNVDAVSDLVLLILLANKRALGQSQLAGSTRLQKLLFLLTESGEYRQLQRTETVPDVRFEPYKMGPFTAKLYEAIDLLTSFDPPLVVATPASSESPDQVELSQYFDEVDLDRGSAATPRPATYELTADGSQVAEYLWQVSPVPLQNSLQRVVKSFAGMPIRELLRYVYTNFPSMTLKSEIRRSIGMS